MTAPFTHLHVASGYSLRYGTSTPAQLVERAVAQGQSVLALTDRDGLYGAVRFVVAAQKAGVAPVLGVDLALAPAAVRSRAGAQPRRTPAKGGQLVDPRYPRVVALAHGETGGLAAGAGWSGLCRLVTDTHVRGERGHPVTTPQLVAAHACGCGVSTPSADAPHGSTSSSQGHRACTDASALTVLLGPDSDMGRAVLAGRRDAALTLLRSWAELMPQGAVAVEIVDHGGPPGSMGNTLQARRMLALAHEAGVPAVLSAAVRHAEPDQARVVDLLDAARRLALLDERHLDRVTTAGHLAGSAEMEAIARRLAGEDAPRLLAATANLAQRCVQRARADLGIGQVHLPEKEVVGVASTEDPQEVLVARCRAAVAGRYPAAGSRELSRIEARLADELGVIDTLGYPTYFLTAARVCDLVRDMGVRVAARGSGAGSLVNYLLGISGVDPIEHDLLMERFCTPLRAKLPDIDIDVESARREDVYRSILDAFGGERVTCVSMMETYRARHAIRDVGAALGLPPSEVDMLAKAFPHIRARDVRKAMADLPELRSLASTYSAAGLEGVFDLVEALDGLPRHVALHPCGVILCNRSLLDRTPVEASRAGFPMSQFDKDDVEDLGLLKLDVLGIRMQSAMAHAVAEVRRCEGTTIDLDDRVQVDLEDRATFELIRSTETLGCFQIESPGQRELLGKFAPETFDDIVIDISLFRPGPIKSDMITPFLRARQGWEKPTYVHPSLAPVLEPTCGVVVFQEQVLQIVSVTTGATLAQSDEVRRALGSFEGREQVRTWWYERAQSRGYGGEACDRIWEVLEAFGSFGFCKAHAAAFALPTVQSAWLKAHHPAAFYAGVLTHDPGMYPKRLILGDARRFGVRVVGLDVNVSDISYRIEPGEVLRLSLMDVEGMSEAEAARIVAGQPYSDMEDFWKRAAPSRPVAERLVLAGGFDGMYGIGAAGETGLGRRGAVTRRDLLLHVSEMDRWVAGRARGAGSRARSRRVAAGVFDPRTGRVQDVRAAAAGQSQSPAEVAPPERHATQLALDLGDAPALSPGSGLPEMSRSEQVQAELAVLGMDVSEHVMDPYADLLAAVGVIRSGELRSARSRSEVLVAGAKVATQTPPVRSGKRVVFVTLDDPSGPVDATFFEDAQAVYASTLFSSWMLVIRGQVRRTGPQGISILADGAWDLDALHARWRSDGPEAVRELIAASPRGMAAPEDTQRRVLVHPTGYRVSPYADMGVPGTPARSSGRKLWHASPGSSGR